MLKRSFDIFFSILFIAVSSPLILVAFLGILLTSPGPIFYLSNRVGKDKRIFKMFKFRTMRQENINGPVITAPNDKRIFPFGSFLRASKIDEIPQFFNILLGDMSFVGPRPEDDKIVNESYEEWMYETLEIRPGLTSPGTLYYMNVFMEKIPSSNTESYYAEEILPKKLEQDLKYVRNPNILWDIKLIAQTATMIVSTMLSGRAI